MRYKVILIVTVMLTAGAVPAAAPAASKGIVGTWFSKGERSRIEIAPCGDKLCGVIAWLKEPNDESGQPLRDILNTDDTVKGRPILGMPVLTELQANGKAYVGQVYDPERGEAFDATVQPGKPGELLVQGCGLMGLVCETEVWTKATPVPAAN